MTEKNVEGNKLNPKDVIVLGVFIHCQGCAQTIHKSLRGFEGRAKLCISLICVMQCVWNLSMPFVDMKSIVRKTLTVIVLF